MRRSTKKILKTYVALSILLLAVPVWADPVTIAALVTAGQTLWAALVVATPYLIVANTIIGGLDARRRAKHAAEDARRNYNNSLQDVGTIALTSEPDVRMIYGTKGVGGHVVAVFNTDKFGFRDDGSAYTRPDGLKHLVIVLGKGPINAITDVLIDNASIGTLTNGLVTSGIYFKASTRGIQVTIGGSGFVDVATPVTSILSSEISTYGSPEAGDGTYQNTMPSTSLSLGNTRITAPVGAVVTYTEDSTSSVIRIQKHLGDPNQTVDTYLNGLIPIKWTANHRLRGLAYVVVTLDLEHEPFQSGLPNMLFICEGLKIYDPRKDSTNGGVGVHRYTDPTTWEFSRNNALVIADYLSQEAGLAVDPSYAIDWPYTIICANDCDVPISLLENGTTITGQPQYVCNGVISGNDDPMNVLADLAASMAGDLVFGAQWYMLAGAWTAPVVTIGDDDLDGEISLLQAGTPVDAMFNSVRGSFIQGTEGTSSDIDPYENTAYLAADGQTIWTDITLPYTDSRYRAKQLCRIAVERNRRGIIIQFPGKLHLWPRRVGQRVFVNSSEYGYVNKPFRIMDWQFDLTSAVVLTLWEDESTVYDYTDATTVNSVATPNLPNPNIVAPIIGLVLATGSSHVRVQSDGTISPRVYASWAAVTDRYALGGGGGYLELKWGTSDNKGGGIRILDVRDTHAYIEPAAREGQWITVSIRLWSGFAFSQLSFASILVLGRGALSSTVDLFTGTQIPGGVSFSWTPATFSGYAQTEIRIGANWATGVRIFSGRVTPAIWHWPAAGTYTAWARHQDTYTGETASSTVTFIVDDAGLITWSNLAITIGGGNLLRNSSFEVDTNSDGLSDDWTAYQVGTVGTVTRSRLTGGIAGGYYQRINASGLGTSANDRAGVYDIVELAQLAGQPFVFSSWMVGLGGGTGGINIRLYVDFYNGAGGTGAITGTVAFTSVTPPVGWQREKLNGIIPAGTMSAICYIWMQERSAVAGAASLDIDAVQFEIGNVITAYAASIAEAETAANNAQALANAANAELANIASDLVLSAGEKPLVIQDYNVITTERTGIDTQATTYGITTEKTAYDTAVNALTTYLGTLTTPTAWNVIPGNTDIVGTTFRQKFADVYSTKQTLLNKIISVAAGNAQTAANNAQTAANNAQTAANTANTALANIASDNIITAGEKPAVILDYTTVTGEQSGIDTRATAFSITTEKTSYDSAISTLTSYLGTLITPTAWNNLSGDTNIVGTTFRTNWANVYSTRQTLLNKIAEIAGTKAVWTSTTGRPVSFRVSAVGTNSTTQPIAVGFYNPETGAQLYAAQRSYMLIRIRRSDGVVTLNAAYDVYGGGAALTNFAAALNATTSADIAVVYTYDEPRLNRLDAGVAAAMYRCGASRSVFGSAKFKYRSAYVLIGIGGCGEGQGFEAYQGAIDSDTNAWCDVAFQVQNSNLLVTGTGATSLTLSNDISVTTQASVTLTHASHSPDGETWRDTVASITYTPNVSGTVVALVTGLWDYIATTTILEIVGGLNISGSWSGFNDTFDAYINTPALGPTYKGSFSTNKGFTVVAGTSYTFIWSVKKAAAADTVHMTNVEMRLDAITV